MLIEVTHNDIAAAAIWAAERETRIGEKGLTAAAWGYVHRPEWHIGMNCPVAKALTRALGSDFDSVGATTILLNIKPFELPIDEDVQDRIERWDVRREMEPFSFEINL